jgi:hypothetical protein
MVSLAVVLAILTAIGPVLELNAAGLHVLAPLIQQRLMEKHKQRLAAPRVNGSVPIHRSADPTCVQFRCGE